MTSRVAVIGLMAGFCAAAAAQLQFSQDARGAVASARRLERPLMVYVHDRTRSTCWRASSWENAPFRDPRVMALAREFVCVEISPDDEYETVRDWGLAAARNMIVFAADDGTLLARATVDELSIVSAARQAQQKFAEHLWQERFSPVLTQKSATPGALQAALEGVRRHRIQAADEPVIKLLERKSLAPAVRESAYKALAALSSVPAVDALLEHAAGDAAAARALEACTAAAVPSLLKALEGTNERQQAVAYRALVKICHVPDARNDAFWSKAAPDARDAEIQRVKTIAEKSSAAPARTPSAKR